MPKAPEKSPDWFAIEAAYRLGVKSLRVIAAEHSITEGAIRLRAKRDDWTRDLSARVKSRTEEKLRKAQVRTELRTDPAYQATERQQVEIAATVQSNVVLEHRRVIGRTRDLFLKLLADLEHQVADPDLFQRIGEVLQAVEKDETGKSSPHVAKAQEALRKVLAMPEHVESAKKLTDMLEKLVRIERQAFGLDDKEPDTGPGAEVGRALTDAERAVRLMHFLKAGGVLS